MPINDGRPIIDTNYTRFARCNNSKCNAVFLFDPREIIGEVRFLCPYCQSKLEDHHMVQCETCQSIVSFIRADVDEVPTVLSIAKCSKCSGTVEDERRILPYEFPDAII